MGPRPPRLAQRLLRWFSEDTHAHAILGDLDEEFSGFKQHELGASRARRWYWRQVLGSLFPLAVGKLRTRIARGPQRRGDGMMSELMQDMRHTFRGLRKSPGFAAVVILTLALGIGANTVIYSAVDGLVLNPFPFPEPDRLVAVGTQYPKLGATEVGFVEHMSPAEYLDLRNGSRSLERVVAWDMGNRQVSFGEVTENVFTGFWWGDAFPTLEVAPFLGRGMTEEETVRGDPVAVLSHRLWAGAFAANESLVGESIIMNGNPFTVVGIMPPRAVLYGMDLWIPMGSDPGVFPRDRRQFQVMARVAQGYGLTEVNAELETLARRTEQAYGADFEEYEGWRLEADTWTGANVGPLKPAAFILLGSVGFVLLLVCTNIGLLLLARSATRRQEMALRRAIGAGRGRLIRQVLTESVTMALAGGALGVGLAWFGVQALSGIVSTIPFVSGGVALNDRVLLFSAMVSVLAGVTFGAAPALQGSADGIHGDLKSDSSGATAPGPRLHVQRFFVGIEVALALVLLSASGLFVTSVIRMNRVDPGYSPEQVLTMRLTLPNEQYDGPAIGAFFRELEERVAALPGVENVGVGSQFPPIAFSYNRVATEDQETANQGQLPTAMSTLVSPGYFDALGIPLLSGRGFTDRDAAGSPMVGVINQAAADLLFPGTDPVGRRILVSGDPLEVVGVVGDALNQGIDSPPFPEVFANHRQVPGWSNQLFVLVRTSTPPLGVLPAIRAEIREMDPDQPVYAISRADQVLLDATDPRRIAANVLSAFAGFAFLLAIVGIFSLVSFSVADRTREIGLRVALGAEGAQLRWLVVRQTLLPVAIGAGFGLGGAIAFGRAIEGLLFEVSGTDFSTLGAVFALLLSAAVIASYIPARRASRLDPVQALRRE